MGQLISNFYPKVHVRLFLPNKCLVSFSCLAMQDKKSNECVAWNKCLAMAIVCLIVTHVNHVIDSLLLRNGEKKLTEALTLVSKSVPSVN